MLSFILPEIATHLAELEVILVVDTRRGSVHADSGRAGKDGLRAHDTSTTDSNLATKGGAGRHGRKAHHGSHCSHFSTSFVEAGRVRK